MSNLLLSERLLLIAKQVNEQDVVADIGTDHSLVPIYLILAHRAKLVYACDIASGPLQIGEENLKKYKVNQDDVLLIKSDGLAWLVDNIKHVDTCIIAGMGGGSIVEILQKDSALVDRYVLSPNCEISYVREWIKTQHYFLEQELLIKENDHIYEILVVNKQAGVRVRNKYDLMFGPILRKGHLAIFQEKWIIQVDRWTTIMSRVESSSRRYRELKRQVAMTNRVLRDNEKIAKRKANHGIKECIRFF